MRLRGFPVDFIRQGGISYPANPSLHKMAVEYAEREVLQPFNMADFRKVIVICEIDDAGTPLRVHGISCERVVSDWPVLRFTDVNAGELLTERMRSYLQDQGLSGLPIFIHVADHEPKESRCPMWRKLLRKMGAEKASRWQVQV